MANCLYLHDSSVVSLRAGSRQKQPSTLPSVPATLKIGPLNNKFGQFPGNVCWLLQILEKSLSAISPNLI